MPNDQAPAKQPSERIWTVESYLRHGETGQLIRNPETGQLIPDYQAVQAAYVEAQAILHRIGGVLQIGTKREEVEPGRVETTELLFRHQSFAPIVHEEGTAPASNGNGEPAAVEEPAETPAG